MWLTISVQTTQHSAVRQIVICIHIPKDGLSIDQTCNIQVKALNDTQNLNYIRLNTNIVIHKDCYSEVWFSVKNSRRTSLTEYGVTRVSSQNLNNEDGLPHMGCGGI